MKHLSLFSGIGGFDLAAHWMGWENVAAVEKEPFCQKVLKKNFPKLKIYGDIKEFKGAKYRGSVDVISGGFPCQPFSVSGKQKAQKDNRFLWPEMLRVIQEIKPSFIVCENVTGIIKLALNQVLTSLENENYTCETFIIPACSLNAPHRRDRVWVIAYSNKSKSNTKKHRNSRQKRKQTQNRKREMVLQKNREISTEKYFKSNKNELATDSERIRQQGQGQHKKQVHPKKNKEQKTSRFNDVGGWPTESPFCRTNDGVSNGVDRLRALGNAIVPQIAYQIFKAIEDIHNP